LAIVKELSEKDIEELIRLKKDGGKKLQELRNERRKLAAQLQKIDGQIAELGGAGDAGEAVPAKPGARSGRQGKPAAGAGGKKTRRAQGLTEAVIKVVAEAGEPLRAREIVEALPGVGFKVKSIKDARKRVSIVLSSQKNKFVKVGRGLYRSV
jgi:hypothetical protein